MKKEFLFSLMIASGCLLSCAGNTSRSDATDAQEMTVQEQTISADPGYKIENGKVVPTNGKPMIVDFSATWCPPCQKLKPIFAELEKEFEGRINFLTVDTDENPTLAQSYGVQSIPMLVFINKDGQIQNTIVGFQNRDQLLAAINTYFGF